MASLREDFAYFYTPDDAAISAALRTGLVSADTNVLLSLYRFQPSAREDLFGALEIIGDRLWIPYQVAFEFQRNRLSVIAAQESYFSQTGDELDTAITGYFDKLRAFAARIALPQVDAHELEKRIQTAHEAVKHQVSVAGQANEVHLNNRESDEVLRRLETLFANRVGEPMKPDQLEAARKEAKRRVDAKIPPGFKDRDKPDPSGDYLIWRQLMTEAATRKLPTILITDDRKEDWFWREHGLTLGARYELREEMAREAGVPFIIMTTATFLVQAEKYLKVSVSPETVSQAKELPDSLAERDLTKFVTEIQRRKLATFRTIDTLERELGEVTQQVATFELITATLQNSLRESPEEQTIEAFEKAKVELTKLRERRNYLLGALDRQRQASRVYADIDASDAKVALEVFIDGKILPDITD